MTNLLLYSLILFTSQSLVGECLKIRGAFDIGSGNTKFKVAKVDSCKNKVLEVLFQTSSPVGYADDARKNNMMLSRKVMKTGYEKIEELLNKGKGFGMESAQGVATAAFRAAKNGPDFIAMVSRRLKVPFQIIDQKIEGALGFYGALARGLDPSAVWDIGGGSMQFVKKNSGRFNMVGCRCGAVEFKNYYLSQVGIPLDQSPNPIGAKNLSRVLGLAKEFIAKSKIGPTPPKGWKVAKIVGIGGVLSKSLPSRINQSDYKKNEVLAALKKGIELNDSQIGSTYAETDITNLALVYQTMTYMGIEAVKSVKVDLTDALLLKKISDFSFRG